jgi:amino acid adenylation domain-containing protein
MNLVEFLQDLVIADWKFWNEGNQLRYSAPKEESTSSIVDRLKQYKAEIIQLLQECPEIFHVYSLSHGQRALWFLWQLAPESHAYNVSLPVCICSLIDIEAIEKAFVELIKRHAQLRSTFRRQGKEIIQQIHQNQQLYFLQVDGSTWSENELKAKVLEAHKVPFDLEKGPVVRVNWFTISSKEHILLLNIHHIVCDGLSLNILLKELIQIYRAQQTGIEMNLPLIKHSYQDYVNWEKRALAGTQGEKLWSYWQKQLAGNLPILNLPTDRQRLPTQTYNGASHKFKLSSALINQVKNQAKSSGVTFYTILLAVFDVLLYRYTGQEDILVGSITLGRSQTEFIPIVGYFVNPVVLRSNLSENIRFEEFLAQVRQTVLEAFTHQDYPFSLLVNKLQPERYSSHSPIFQASFTLQQLQQSQNHRFGNLIEINDGFGGMQLRLFDIPQQEGQFDLVLEVIEDNLSTSAILSYNVDLFDNTTIERMASHFENLLSAIVANPQQKVGEIPLLSVAERQQLLLEWNDTATDYPRDKCIHQLFEEQVKKTPDAVAVVFEDEQLTYQQLNERANQLAHYLHSLGVEPDVLVGICVERSLEMVVGLLGILKAGGAYVPLDPSYPTERLSYMLSDTGASVLLTQHNLLSVLPSHAARMVCLNTNWAEIASHSQENLVTNLSSNNLAYVIYTSGSTGQPKGVMNTHQSIHNRLQWMQAAYQLTNCDRVLQKTPFSFDVSVWEFFWPLLTGARIVVARPEGHKDSHYLINLIAQAQITTLHFVPSMLQVFLQEQNLAVCRCLQRVFCSGEALPVELMERFFEHFDCEFHNLYGPTEAAIDVTFWQCQPQADRQVVPIGRPISNTQVYILDSQMQPVPIGVAGELHIGGDGLARGYLNRPELTASKFVPNPFSPDRSARLYKTGDLARYQLDGNIEFLGRLDHQVKIRGFRIELSEVEAVLCNHPQVQQAVAIAIADLNGNKRLVAYVVVNDEEHLSTQQLREYLQQQLPAYMVPSVFVILDTLPLTPNGKVDRKALPAPDGEIEREHEYVAPRTEIEQILVNIFSEVLGIETIGIHDNFFELGGHSLLATQLISRLRQALQIDISVRILFETSTIAGLADCCNIIIWTNQQTQVSDKSNDCYEEVMI